MRVFSLSAQKKVWRTVWDLSSADCRVNWQQMPHVRKRFEDDFDFEVVLASLPIYPHSFAASCAASVIATELGLQEKMEFVDACFENQDRYLELKDARPSLAREVLADIAKGAGLLKNDKLPRETFLSLLESSEKVAQAAWLEHQQALHSGVFKSVPAHVVDGRLLEEAQSGWKPADFVAALGWESASSPVDPVAKSSFKPIRPAMTALGQKMMPSWTVSGSAPASPYDPPVASRARSSDGLKAMGAQTASHRTSETYGK